jgi:hypothetical protein
MKGQRVLERPYMNFIPDPINIVSIIIIIIITNIQGKSGTPRIIRSKKIGAGEPEGNCRANIHLAGSRRGAPRRGGPGKEMLIDGSLTQAKRV